MLKHKKVIKMKLNKIILSFCVSILGLYSCSIAPTLSKFPVSEILFEGDKNIYKDGVSKCKFHFDNHTV